MPYNEGDKAKEVAFMASLKANLTAREAERPPLAVAVQAAEATRNAARAALENAERDLQAALVPLGNNETAIRGLKARITEQDLLMANMGIPLPH